MQEKFRRICAEEYRLRVTEALNLMRLGHYFDAHEHFERLFRNTTGEQRTLFHALTQLAVSHHQLRLGRARAAVRTWIKARTKLVGLGLLPPGLDVSMAAFHAALGIDVEQPRFLDPAQLGAPQSFPVFELECE